MKHLVGIFVLSALALAIVHTPVSADDIKINPDRYGALAYSVTTGKYGYAWNRGSRADAERVALSECKADDAKVLTWVKFGWAVLVIAEDKAYGFDEVHGDGVTSAGAYENALKSLRTKSNAKVKTIIIICSGDYPPMVENK